MQFRYGLDEKPPLIKTLLFGFQWAALLISTIIILGKVVGTIHYPDQYGQILYLQKLLFLSSVTLVIQIFYGHRLPLLPGPSAVLLIGVIACRSFSISEIYSSIIIGGAVIAVFSASGLSVYINRFFTGNVISVVLILIAFTIAPTIMELMTDKKSGVDPAVNLGFSLVAVFIMFLMHRVLKGILKSTIIIWAVILGTFIYNTYFAVNIASVPDNLRWANSFLKDMNFQLSFHPGVIVSFMFCFIALVINDLGSIQSVNEVIETVDRDRRVKRGLIITGASNIAAGFMGIIGPVNYSISPGVMLNTGCASRYTLIPAGVIMFLLSLMPVVTGYMGNIPSVVIGSILAYVMASQIAAGLIVAFRETETTGFRMENGMVIGISIFLGTIVAFLPQNVIESIPVYLRPVLTNGFVAGVICAVIVEQILFKKNRQTENDQGK